MLSRGPVVPSITWPHRNYMCPLLHEGPACDRGELNPPARFYSISLSLFPWSSSSTHLAGIAPGLHHKKGVRLVLQLRLQGRWFPCSTYLLAQLHIPMGFHQSVCLPAHLLCVRSKSGSSFPCTSSHLLNFLCSLNSNCPVLSSKASLNPYVCLLSWAFL